jgi:hypothetical protein
MIVDLINRNKHKLEPAPICKLYNYNHDFILKQ